MSGISRQRSLWGVLGIAAAIATAIGTAASAHAAPVGASAASTMADPAAGGVTVATVWTLVCAFLVMFMQAGFALVATGFCRAKNASHTVAMNLIVYCIGTLAYWGFGFALQMGGVNTPGRELSLHLFGHDFGLLGTSGFFVSGNGAGSVMAAFLLQAVVIQVAAIIPSGAMAERLKVSAFAIYTFFMCGILCPLYANWVWGGGWLASLGTSFGLGHGYLDFAGASVVHVSGGVAALAGALVLGPRLGKYNRDGLPTPIPGHHIPMAILGTLILAFGWFGFTAGTALGSPGVSVVVVASNTILAGAAGGLLAMLWMWFRYGKPDLTMSANGILAGLVAVSASCAYVGPCSAVLTGGVAGVLCCLSVFFVERVLKVDDPVGAISVHGVCGAWGVLAAGLFADGVSGTGLNGVSGAVAGAFHGDYSQLAAQGIGLACNIAFVFAGSYLFFRVLDRAMGVRVAPEIEREGLDQYEVAAAAYPEFSLRQLPFSSGYSKPRQ